MKHLFLAQAIPPIHNPVINGTANKPPEAVFGSFISGIIGVALIAASLWVLLMLIQGGLEWIGSGGDKSGLENARNRITNALIGLLIVFAAWAIYLVILQFFGISTTGGGLEFKLPALF